MKNNCLTSIFKGDSIDFEKIMFYGCLIEMRKIIPERYEDN